MLRRLPLILSLLCWSLLLLGATCSSQPPKPKPKRYDLHLTVGSGLSGASVQVDIIGTSARTDLARLEQHPISEYWKKDDKLRLESNRKSFTFSPSGPREATLSATDEIWNTWMRSGAEVLVIIADWTALHTDRPGTSDRRRAIVTIDEGYWHKTPVIEVVIKESGITVTTVPPAK
jgi:hypothetical protein